MPLDDCLRVACNPSGVLPTITTSGEGRLKQIIVRGGSNISPQEVEEPLYQHAAVLESAVIGMPDPVHGEKVIAFVALRDGFTATETELRDFVRMPHR